MKPLDAKKTHRRSEAVILFSVAANIFAISASAVEEIRSAQDLRPLAAAYPHLKFGKVRHAITRDGKTFFVVDANMHFRMLPSHPTRVLLLRGTRIALMVDAIDRMTEISTLYSLPRAFHGEERVWYRGLALLNDQVIPVVSPAAFLSKAELDLVQQRMGHLDDIAEGAVRA
jgi:chemotaxis signal transduction protein